MLFSITLSCTLWELFNLCGGAGVGTRGGREGAAGFGLSSTFQIRLAKGFLVLHPGSEARHAFPSYIPAQGVSERSGTVGEDRSRNPPCAAVPTSLSGAPRLFGFFHPLFLWRTVAPAMCFPSFLQQQLVTRKHPSNPGKSSAPRILLRMSSCGLRDGEPSLILCCIFLDFSISFSIR